MSLSSGTRLGPYEIVGVLGAGGMGEVYRAHDPRTGRDIAVKTISERFTDRFSREIRAVAAVNHPHVCQLYDVGPDYLVMELCEGETLAERLVRGKLPMHDALRYGAQIADALSAAHAKGIVHRDLKPGNIMLTHAGVKVLDFGLAKITHTAAVSEGSDTLTDKRTVLGTVQYMSPEQAQGKETDARSDIFSFGLVFYEMICGKRAFTGSSSISIIAAILERDAPELEPEGLNRIVKACLEKDPATRFQSARDLRMALDWSVSGVGMPAPSAGIGWRNWLPWSVAGVLAMALIGLAVSYSRSAQQSVTPLHFQIAAPQNSRLLLNLSPDGRNIAFVGEGRLWVHSLVTGESRDLAVPAGGVPFWSPDGRFIGFPSDGKLKRIEAAGGPPQTIADLTRTSAWGGGTWNQDDVIVFGKRTQGLFRVPASGGVVVPIVTLDATQHENSTFCPVFLPDGRRFLYVRSSTDEGKSAIYVGSIDANPANQSATPLLASNSQPAYAPPVDGGSGHVIFMRGGSLMAQPFDDRQLTLTGQPYVLATQVSISVAGAIYVPFSVSATNMLASPRSGTNERQLIWYDRDGKVTGTVGEPGLIGEFALSPDGSRIALVRNGGTADTSNLWLLDSPNGRAATRFTFGSLSDSNPVWAPDGRRIVFSSNRDGAFNLFLKHVDGSREDELLLKSSADKFATSWSADGRFLLYSVRNQQTKSDIWVLPLEGERRPVPFLATRFDENNARLSPDGKWVAYQSDESGQHEIYVRSIRLNATGTSIEASGGLSISGGFGTDPYWRGDSRELFYRSGDGSLEAVEISTVPSFHVGATKHLGFFASEASNDGRRFLGTGNPGGPRTYNLILNWQAGLKK